MAALKKRSKPIIINLKSSLIDYFHYYYLFLYCLLLLSAKSYIKAEDSCVDERNKAKSCYPEFENIAYERQVIVTNTCGENGPSEFCIQSSLNSFAASTCDVCDNKQRVKAHPPEYLTDKNSVDSPTWWQSETMEMNLQHPNSVNLTLHLGKAYVITYIQLKFQSPRPESFAIYKRVNESSEWEPYQFYSGDCMSMYNRPNRGLITVENETIALCTDEFSDISPLTGGNVAFSTLEARPNAYYFDQSPQLKQWVTATDIKLTLNRMNTYGDDVFGDPQVLRSYFYAISDLAIGGRCECHGHASKCVAYEDSNLETKYRCACQHNTDGVDCEKCLPFYNNKPWSPAGYLGAFECEICDCKGLSETCVFNQTLYDLTGQGGHCTNCRGNTEGPHCEQCKFSYYPNENDECVECGCHPLGSMSQQCDPSGKCKCKPGVDGEKCDRCAAGHYELSYEGCKECTCFQAGSLDYQPACDPINGQCRCKQNVEGKNCDRCKPGFYGLDEFNSYGCLPCFCFGHSSECKSSSNHLASVLDSNFYLDSSDNWTALDKESRPFNFGYEKKKGLFVYNQDKDVWFSASKKYLGYQRNSYNQELRFKLKYSPNMALPAINDLIFENSHEKLILTRSLYDLKNLSLPYDSEGRIEQEFTIKLNEHDRKWRQSLSFSDFQRLFSNLTSLKIRTLNKDYTFLTQFELKTAVRKESVKDSLESVSWIEQCTCPMGYMGQFCEQCAPGYTRETQYGSAFVKCVPCSCNNHSKSCDPQSGKCQCVHHTTGENCESCKQGYYGNALQGTSDDCKKCTCPNDGSCAQFYNHMSETNEVVCLNCPEGNIGNLCLECDDGYYKINSESTFTKCAKCDCYSNIDANAIGNCDPETGKCLRCVYNTTGDKCERCLDSYWGNALTKQKCHACECHLEGSVDAECDLTNGQCKCKKNVVGRRCDECRDRFYNISSNEGCFNCKCNPLGSESLVCDKQTGACKCRPGVTGEKCDQCMSNHYGFSMDGCKKCECDLFGSESFQCDEEGTCTCKERISGTKCNKCAENFHNFTAGCQKCDDCFSLVQKSVDGLRTKISDLDSSLNSFKFSLNANSLSELDTKMQTIKNSINKMHSEIFNKDLNMQNSYNQTLAVFKRDVDVLGNDFNKNVRAIDRLNEKIQSELSPIDTRLEKTLNDLKLEFKFMEVSFQEAYSSLEQTIEDNQEYLSALSERDPNMHKLKELAAQARETAHKHDQIAKEYRQKVLKYTRASTESITLLNVLIGQLESIKEISSSQINNALDYDELLKLSTSIIEESKEIKSNLDKDVVELKSLIGQLRQFTHPSFDQETRQTQEKINEIKTNTSLIKLKVDELNKEFSRIEVDSNKELTRAREKLELFEINDQKWSNLKLRSEKARNKTSDGFDLANEAYRNATKIHESLKNFEQELEANKKRAQEAEKLEDEIERNLIESKEYFDQINKELDQLKSNDVQMSSNLNYVESNVAAFAQDYEQLESKSSDLKEKVERLSKMATSLKENYDDSAESIENSLNKYDQLPERMKSLQVEVGQLSESSQKLYARVLNADESLSSYDDLDISHYQITDSDLDRLNKSYQETLEMIDGEMRLGEQTIQSLEEAYSRNLAQLNAYKLELPYLTQQINELDYLRISMQCGSTKRR